MILDAIIGLFVSLIAGIAMGASLLLVSVVNLLAAAAEAILGLFISGFHLGRMKKWERKSGVEDHKPEAPDHPMAIWWSVVTAMAIFAAIFLGPKIINQKVTLIAKDGTACPSPQ